METMQGRLIGIAVILVITIISSTDHNQRLRRNHPDLYNDYRSVYVLDLIALVVTITCIFFQ